MMSTTVMAADTSEVSTWAHSTEERLMGMEWNRWNKPLCTSVNRRIAV